MVIMLLYVLLCNSSSQEPVIINEVRFLFFFKRHELAELPDSLTNGRAQAYQRAVRFSHALPRGSVPEQLVAAAWPRQTSDACDRHRLLATGVVKRGRIALRRSE